MAGTRASRHFYSDNSPAGAQVATAPKLLATYTPASGAGNSIVASQPRRGRRDPQFGGRGRQARRTQWTAAGCSCVGSLKTRQLHHPQTPHSLQLSISWAEQSEWERKRNTRRPRSSTTHTGWRSSRPVFGDCIYGKPHFGKQLHAKERARCFLPTVQQLHSATRQPGVGGAAYCIG